MLLRASTISLWSFVNEHLSSFQNVFYDALAESRNNQAYLVPVVNQRVTAGPTYVFVHTLKALSFWQELYLRWYEEPLPIERTDERAQTFLGSCFFMLPI